MLNHYFSRWHGERRQHPQASDYPATPFDGPPSHHYNSSGYGQQYGNSPQNHHHHRIPSLTPLHPTPPLHAHHHTNAGPSGHHGHAQAPNDNGEQPVKKFHKKKERARALRELKEAAAALGTSAPSSFTDSSVPTSHGESPQPYQRRKKQARDAPPPVPSAAYLATTQEAVSPAAADAPPPLLILDLNNTLLMRKTRDAVGSKSPIARPYLSTFLQYACGKDATTGQRRWDAVVYSSARSHNVLSLLMATRLVPIERAKTVKRGDAWEAKEGEALRYVQTRENMGLTAKEYDADVETVKDLSKIWETLSGTGSERTVLLDDEAGKAVSCSSNGFATLALTLSLVLFAGPATLQPPANRTFPRRPQHPPTKHLPSLFSRTERARRAPHRTALFAPVRQRHCVVVNDLRTRSVTTTSQHWSFYS